MSPSTSRDTNPSASEAASDASRRIDARIEELADWRGRTLARVREIIHRADPEVIEEWKWRGVPVWSHAGILCTGETYREVVKLTFAKGASLPDPSRLFNASLDGGTRRAIDIREGEAIDAKALTALIRAALAANLEKPAKKRAASGVGTSSSATTSAARAAKPAAKASAKFLAKTAGKTPSKPATKSPAKSAAKSGKSASKRTAKGTAGAEKASAKPARKTVRKR